MKTNLEKIERICNGLELIGVTLVLFLTLMIEFVLKEEPCPLCLLQRIGMFSVAIGFLMNLRFSPHPRHYAMIILGSLFTSLVALRQIALNLDSPTGGFGSPIFGLHLYTWSFIISIVIIIATTLIMTIDRNYLPIQRKNKIKPVVKAIFIITGLMLLINVADLMS